MDSIFATVLVVFLLVLPLFTLVAIVAYTILLGSYLFSRWQARRREAGATALTEIEGASR